MNVYLNKSRTKSKNQEGFDIGLNARNVLEWVAGLAQCIERTTTYHTAESGRRTFESDLRPFSLSAPAFLSFSHCICQIKAEKGQNKKILEICTMEVKY